MQNQERNGHWEIIVAMGMMLIAIIGVNVPLFIMTDNKIEAIRQDVRDFHERLIRIEEKRK